MSATLATDSAALTIHLATDYVATIKTFTVTLDEGRAPYGEAVVTIVLPAQSTADLIDPRNHLRATLVLTRTTVEPTVATQTRSFDLYLHARVKDPAAGEMTLTFLTDEALLIDDMRGGTTPDASAEPFAPSLRAIVNKALTAYGASLTLNRATNPGMERDATGWSADIGGGTATSARVVSTGAFRGTYDWRITYSVAPTGPILLRYSGTPVMPGEVVSAGIWAKIWGVTVPGTYKATLTIYAYNSSGTYLGNVKSGTATAFAGSNTWSYFTVENATIPANTATIRLELNLPTNAFLTASARVEADNALIVSGAVAPPKAEADLPDVDYTITAPATNLARNPRFAYSTPAQDWATTITSGARTLSYPTTGGPLTNCPSYSRATVTTALTAPYTTKYDRAQFPTTINQQVAVSVWVRSSAAIDVTLEIGIYNSAGAQTGAPVTFATLTANTWTEIHNFVTADRSGSGNIEPRLYTGTTLAVGATLDITGLGVYVGGSLPDYFDGATATDFYYSYSFTGINHESPSERAQLIPRDPGFLRRLPGTREWDFLQPLVSAGGLRLFCDENRTWRLVDPAYYAVAGTVSVTDAVNITGAVETIDLGQADSDQANAYAEAVVVHYTWRSRETGEQLEAFDAAGDISGVGFVVEVDAAYPGPGAAASILSRAAGRGRNPQLSALTNLAATPGMTLIAAQPQSTSLTGILSSVTWTDNDEMAVTGRSFA